MRHYVYNLRLIPRLWDHKNWSETESQIISEHFNELKKLKDKGSLILAGKTDAEDY